MNFAMSLTSFSNTTHRRLKPQQHKKLTKIITTFDKRFIIAIVSVNKEFSQDTHTKSIDNTNYIRHLKYSHAV